MTAQAAASTSESEAGRVGVTLLGLVVQVTGPAYHALLARALGVGNYGLFTWSWSVIDGLSLFVLFGMELAVRQYVGHALAIGKPEEVHTTVGSALRVVVLAAVAFACAMFFAAPYIGIWQHKPALVPVLRTLALLPLFVQPATVLLCASQSAHVMKHALYARSLVQPILLFSLLGLAAYFRPGPVSAAAAIVVASIGTLTASAVLYDRFFGLRRTLAAATRGSLDGRLYRFAKHLVIGGAFWMILGRMDLVVFGQYVSPTTLGVFAGCLLFASSVSQMKSAFDAVVASIIPGALAHRDFTALRASMRRQARWTAIVCVPLVVLFGGFSDVVLLVLGNDFAAGARALRILLVAQLVNALCVTGLIIPMSGRTIASGATALTCALLELVLLRALIPRYGLEGAAVASAAGVVTAQLALTVQAFVHTRVHPFSIPLIRIVAAGALATVAGRFVLGAMSGPLFVRFAVAVVASGAVYLSTLAAMGIEPEERALLARGLELARRRS